ncbi:O-antigen ligase family protein [Neobacillus vireti]|uniref:O-antigen ligase family protein n=1 Tax=Neobacillus vireti TaxID=220686 RepID=UPI003000EC0E
MFRILYLFLWLFPFFVFPFNQYITTVKMGLLAYLCFALWLYILIKSYRQRQRVFQGAPTWPEKLLLLWAIWIGLSTVLSKHPYISIFGEMTRHEGLLALYSYFTVFVISFRLVPAGKVRSILSGLVGASMIACLFGLYQKFHHPLLPYIDGTGRIESFFGNANFYGSYLVVMLFLAIILVLHSKERKQIGWFSFAANFLLLNMLYTGTRSAFLGTIAGLLFYSPFIWLKFPALRKRFAMLLVSFALIFTFVNALENSTYLQRIFSIFLSADQVLGSDDSEFAGSGRWGIWKTALPLVAEYPIFGSGPDTLGYVIDQDAVCQYFQEKNCSVDKAHNEYLQIAITMGIPALLFYLSFLSCIFWGVWKAIKKASGEKQLILSGLFALIFAYVIQAFFNISVVPVAPYFWFILGIVYRLKEEWD